MHKISVSKKLLCWDATGLGGAMAKMKRRYNHFYSSDGDQHERGTDDERQQPLLRTQRLHRAPNVVRSHRRRPNYIPRSGDLEC
jgi:hypothetical protein